MAKQECSNPAVELDQETLDAAGRCWEFVSRSVLLVNQTSIGKEIAKRGEGAA